MIFSDILVLFFISICVGALIVVFDASSFFNTPWKRALTLCFGLIVLALSIPYFFYRLIRDGVDL